MLRFTYRDAKAKLEALYNHVIVSLNSNQI